MNWAEAMWRTVWMACDSWHRTARLCLVLVTGSATLTALYIVVSVVKT